MGPRRSGPSRKGPPVWHTLVPLIRAELSSEEGNRAYAQAAEACRVDSDFEWGLLYVPWVKERLKRIPGVAAMASGIPRALRMVIKVPDDEPKWSSLSSNKHFPRSPAKVRAAIRRGLGLKDAARASFGLICIRLEDGRVPLLPPIEPKNRTQQPRPPRVRPPRPSAARRRRATAPQPAPESPMLVDDPECESAVEPANPGATLAAPVPAAAVAPNVDSDDELAPPVPDAVSPPRPTPGPAAAAGRRHRYDTARLARQVQELQASLRQVTYERDRYAARAERSEAGVRRLREYEDAVEHLQDQLGMAQYELQQRDEEMPKTQRTLVDLQAARAAAEAAAANRKRSLDEFGDLFMSKQAELEGTEEQLAGVHAQLAGKDAQLAGAKTELAGKDAELAGVKTELAGATKRQRAQEATKASRPDAVLTTMLSDWKAEKASMERLLAEAKELERHVEEQELMCVCAVCVKQAVLKCGHCICKACTGKLAACPLCRAPLSVAAMIS